MNKVLKESSYQITHKTVWLLSGPMIISNISVPLVGAVDTAVVGHLPEPYHIGAVALGALIFSFLYWGFGFLKMGITGFIARAFGAHEKQLISDTVLRFMLMGLLFGLLVVLFRQPLIDFALYCIDGSENTEKFAEEYSLIRIWSAPATLLVYVFTGLFVGLHNTKRALALQLVLNLTNIVLDLLFVPVLQWGVAGVAWATLIAEYCAMFYGLYLLRDILRQAFQSINYRHLFALNSLKQIFSTNVNIFIRTLCLVFSFAYFTAQSAKQGEMILAVNVVLLHLQSIMAYALDGFAHSAEALAGSAYGEGRVERFKKAVKLTTIWSGFCAFVVCGLYWFFAGDIIALFSDSEKILEAAEPYLIWMIITPAISFLSFQLDGIFIGTGYARQMRNAMIISMIGYLVMVTSFQNYWQNHGLFLALSAFMVLRAISLLVYYPRMIKGIQPNKP